MTIYPLLNWAVVTVSLFNTIALIWLGLTVLLNAERPRWGTWLVGGGLLLGGLFFTAHSAAVGRGIIISDREARLWLHFIWLPFVAGPYLWYLVMAWYTGALGNLKERRRMLAASALGLFALALPLVVDPNPSYEQLRGQPGPPLANLAGIPAALLVYPVYSLICMGRAIAVLLQPGASDRFMGDLARRRARPWLVASSVILVAVTFAAGGAAAWVLLGIAGGLLDVLSEQTLTILYLLDLLVAGLISVGVVLMGMAIVAYEIFTGKTLPRGGLFRYWRNSLLLAAGYGAVLAASLDLPVPSIYRLMLATVLMTLFYALLSWRSYAERERSMQRLRPFLTSQHLYEQLVGPGHTTEQEFDASFRALCDALLDARSAALIPLGSLAPFVGPVAFPQPGPPQLPATLVEQLRQPQTLCLPVEPSHFQGAIWAIPLWSERGLIGAFLLGPKRDDGLYTQEEIEVARAAGERLIDTRASAELARRLVGLQRQRLAESQVIDQRTRRVLHDDVLPQLHTAMIMLQAPDSTTNASSEATSILADAHHRIADLLHALPTPAGSDIARVGLLAALRNVVNRELDGQFDSVIWEISADAERSASALAPSSAEVVFFAGREALRNAARYARGNQPRRNLTLRIIGEVAAPPGQGLRLQIIDDGVGLGAATSQQGGAGRGLALHGALLALVGGALEAERGHEGGTQIRITVGG